MPVSNLLRVRLVPDSLRLLSSGGSAGVITIVGESFIAQYRLTFAGSASQQLPSAVEIQPSQCRPLDFPGITLTTGEMKRFALRILESGEKSAVSKTRAYGITACLNHVYTVGDHIFLDLSFRNDSNLPYDIDELRFKIEDKKINKATNEQSLEIKPEWQLYPPDRFRQEYHNIYVFKKVTFPDDKILRIGLSEKQVSGRTITLQVKYADLLRADHL